MEEEVDEGEFQANTAWSSIRPAQGVSDDEAIGSSNDNKRAPSISVAVCGIGAVAFLRDNGKEVVKALDLAFKQWAQVANIKATEGGSVLVELCFGAKEGCHDFAKDFMEGTVKERLKLEIKKIGFTEDFELKIQDEERYVRTEPESRPILFQDNSSSFSLGMEERKNLKRKRKQQKPSSKDFPTGKGARRKVWDEISLVDSDDGQDQPQTSTKRTALAAVGDTSSKCSKGRRRKLYDNSSPVDGTDGQHQPQTFSRRTASKASRVTSPTPSQSTRKEVGDNTKPRDSTDDQSQPKTFTKTTAPEDFGSGVTSPTRSAGTEGILPENANIVSEDSASLKRKASNEKEFSADIVFALDNSSSVRGEELKMEIDFVQHLSESLNVDAGNSAAAVVLYGDNAKAVIAFDRNGKEVFCDKLEELKTKVLNGKTRGISDRRMDLALKEAADILQKEIRNQHQLVILFTAGKQLSNKEQKEADNDLLTSTYAKLFSQDIRVIVVPIGLETDFKELGLIVKRPQSLFPLSSFGDLKLEKAQAIAVSIKRTIDLEVYAMNTCASFSGKEVLEGEQLWESIGLCSDVMEGAWYLLYDVRNKPEKTMKIKRLIRESIDNFHGTLVSDSKVSISLAVCGPLGAGKSFFMNSLLNWDLDKFRMQNGPLPSAHGDSQTPIPISVKYGKRVQVIMYNRQKGEESETWLQPEDLGTGTLARVHKTLTTNFKEFKGSCNECHVELRGPFPIFQFLKKREMTTTGQLELDIEVEFVDLPGYGDKIGNETINIALSKADVVLFYDGSKSGRPVSSEDIAQVFRKRGELDFLSRPKLVHLINDWNKPASYDTIKLCEKREELKTAWSGFLSSSADDNVDLGCYQDVKEKLPLLNGEVLLEKLCKESDVIYFHPEDRGWLEALRDVIDDHIHNVKIKQRIHPFVKNVHWAAKILRISTRRNLIAEKKKHLRDEGELREASANFELFCDGGEEAALVESFVSQSDFPVDSDLQSVFQFLNESFPNFHATTGFLVQSIKSSLVNYYHRVIEVYKNVNWSKTQDIPDDATNLVKMVCRDRVKQYCANIAPTYLVDVLKRMKKQSPPSKLKKAWSRANSDQKKNICVDYLNDLLKRTKASLEKRSKAQFEKSHFNLIDQLNQVVKDMFDFKSSDVNENRSVILESLYKKLDIVIKYCTKTIRDINPHPRLDVQTDPLLSLPENMICANEAKGIKSKRGEIINEVTEFLVKSPTRGANAVRKLESKLDLKMNSLQPKGHLNPERRRQWAESLLNVLADKNHFDVPLDERLNFFRDEKDKEADPFLKKARKRLFAHEKSLVKSEFVYGQDLPKNELHLKKSCQAKNRLQVLVSSEMESRLKVICKEFDDPMQQLAPIFIPTIRPGPTVDIRGNFFLEVDPWSKGERLDEENIEDANDEGTAGTFVFNIFLVVEEQYLKVIKNTIESLEVPKNREIFYVILPQQGRGIGVTRAIIKSLAEALRFHLYWTVDDDIQFMYQFDENAREWVQCSIGRGLLFGQRVFQTCLREAVKELPVDERCDLFYEVTRNWPDFAKEARKRANILLLDQTKFAKLQRNPSLLHSPFEDISADCGGDSAKEEQMKTLEEEFVRECKKRLFEDAINHIAGVSLAHVSTKKYDYMSKYSTADYMVSDQRYQVVLHNTEALKEKNYVSDEVIFHPDEYQIRNKDKRNTPYWGVRGADKSFSRALTVAGVIGYQVIRVVHSHKKLINVFDRVGPSYIASQSPHGSEDEENVDVDS